MTWHEGLSAERVQKALNKFQIEEMANGFYRFNHMEYKDLKILLESFGLRPERKLYSAGDLQDLVSKLDEIK